ncbi:ribosome maturation factor RimP [Hymenobacter psychrotolerans]|uniref:Ribosome maturation factor RimP n=1 Tax=Hymenobacter psychrotolerans DSM 18569 TaxID=1121959 RepID=A0A1M6NU78_9BACT|nr:ribosome maturation factor [Hymenobacter psychrotolerans]SHJ99276.1 ribosome maturation factor RimP [Hymenobacter psychrotolerans DSM 18569]
MNFDQNRIAEMLQDSLAGFDLFVVDLSVSDAIRPKITVTLDSEQGLGIDECAKVSRRLAKRIDEAYGEDATYSLEVTSPGADQPLTDPRQYTRHVGRTFSLKLQDGTEKTGKLEAIEAEGIQLAEVIKDKSKTKTLPAVLVPFTDIQEARIVISFK